MDPARWDAATSSLTGCLRKLSGDEITFTWPARSKITGLGSHRAKLPRGFDAVCLFSGGVDSLLGAFRLVSDGKKVLLVGHQADGTAASAQTQLAAALRQNFPKQVALIQCRVSRGWTASPRFPLPEKCEDTHRPRSFLFLGVAIAVANAAGIGDIYIPENGLIALNPPLQISRIGSLSTRTAHPIFLTRFLDFLQGARLYAGSIRNPFLYQSKTDMLRELDPALSQAVVRSVSCARPQRYKDRGVRHCGYCVPCVYRRVSLMAAGLDRAGEYAFDVYNDLPSMTPTTQADFKALVQFAQRVTSATPATRDLIVLSHGYFPHDVGARIGPAPAPDYSPWSEMMLRWAGDFLDRLDALASSRTREIVGLPRPARSVQPA
jgi:7-cyano-7-deazaguanine synthase in queuosine biosynthesis